MKDDTRIKILDEVQYLLESDEQMQRHHKGPDKPNLISGGIVIEQKDKNNLIRVDSGDKINPMMLLDEPIKSHGRSGLSTANPRVSNLI